MSEVQIAIIDQENTQIALAVPGVQGPAGAISSGGSANQVFYKVSGTNYDAGWTFIGNANVDAAAAIAGTKISPNFGSQAILTTGTNTAASFSPTSNTIPTNGVYLPAANSVAISTNGSGRLFVDSAGKISIASAAVTFFPTIFNIRSTSGSVLSLSSADTTTGAADTGVVIDFRHNDGSSEKGAGELRFLKENSTVGNNSTYFAIVNRLNDTATERFRITSTGALNFVGAGTAGSTQAVSFNGSAPVNSMVLTSGGLLGIGTSIVSDKLEIANGTTDAANALGIRSGRYLNASQEGAQLKYYSDNTASWLGTREVARIGAYGLNSDHRIGSLAFALKTTNSASDPTEMMRLTPTGLGIGNTGPSLRLDVAATGDDGIRFSTTGTNNSARLELSSGNGTTSGKYAYIQIRNNDTNAQGYAFGTFGDDRWVIRDTKANSERLCVDTSGRLLVGTTSSTGSVSNTAPVIAGLFQSFDDVSTFANGVAQTLFTIPNLDATYIITLRRPTVGDAANYHAVSILSTNATVGGSVSTVLTALKTAGNVSISISGTNLQGTQTTGGSALLRWVVTRVG